MFITTFCVLFLCDAMNECMIYPMLSYVNHPGIDFIVPVYQTEVEGIMMEVPKFAAFDNRSREQCEAAVIKSGWYLEFVPTALKTEHMCLTAMQTRGHALMWVPMELRTIAVCKAALENDPDANSLSFGYQMISSGLVQPWKGIC